MRVTYDAGADAAYIYLRSVGRRAAVRQHLVDDDATQVIRPNPCWCQPVAVRPNHRQAAAELRIVIRSRVRL